MSKYLLAIFSRHIHNHSAAFATALWQAERVSFFSAR